MVTAVISKPRTGYEAWKDGVDKADASWDVHDPVIRETVNEYNRHLFNTPGYLSLDWKIVKAMLWVESGPHQPDWKMKPMQIGKLNDPGLRALLGGQEGGELILPPSFHLTESTIKTQAQDNIRAGVGYLLMRMAEFKFTTVMDKDASIYEVAVVAGDSLEKIAKAKGSTVEVLRKLNPTAHLLKIGQKLKYQKASIKKVINRWQAIDSASIANRYNGGGDPLYAQKMRYALEAVRK